MGTRVTRFVAGSAWALVELLLTLFVLFYLFRDRRKALGTLRSLVPLSEREADEVFTRVSDTIHATVYGTLVVAAVQGALGGLIFWCLGLPAPILWGTVMGLHTVPVFFAIVGALRCSAPAAGMAGLQVRRFPAARRILSHHSSRFRDSHKIFGKKRASSRASRRALVESGGRTSRRSGLIFSQPAARQEISSMGFRLRS